MFEPKCKPLQVRGMMYGRTLSTKAETSKECYNIFKLLAKEATPRREFLTSYI